MIFPTKNDIVETYQRISPHIHKTPLLESERLNRHLGIRLFVKAENLQKTGSFKYRGAKAAILQLKEKYPTNIPAVLSWSSGNHGRAIAEAAAQENIDATIVIPDSIPDIKRKAIERAGAKTLYYSPKKQEKREEVAQKYAEQHNVYIIPPYDQHDIISGQGTIGLEIAEQLAEKNTRADAVIIPCGGGGLAAGIGIVCKATMPKTLIFGVEPAGFDDTKLSLSAGKIKENSPQSPHSICDALMTTQPGQLTFAINQTNIKDVFVINDKKTAEAVKILFEEFKLVTEAAGAIALASLIEHQKKFREKTIIVIASGGNIDALLFKKLITNS